MTEEEGDDEEDGGKPDVVDPITGFPRVLRRKCGTCLYLPEGQLPVRPGRREQMERDAIHNGSWIPCHSTIYRGDVDPAICRGFFNVAKDKSMGLRLM